MPVAPVRIVQTLVVVRLVVRRTLVGILGQTKDFPTKETRVYYFYVVGVLRAPAGPPPRTRKVPVLPFVSPPPTT